MHQPCAHNIFVKCSIDPPTFGVVYAIGALGTCTDGEMLAMLCHCLVHSHCTFCSVLIKGGNEDNEYDR